MISVYYRRVIKLPKRNIVNNIKSIRLLQLNQFMKYGESRVLIFIIIKCTLQMLTSTVRLPRVFRKNPL